MPGTIPPRLDRPELARKEASIGNHRLGLVAAVNVQTARGARVQRAEMISTISVGLDLPELAPEVAVAGHFDLAGAGENFEGVAGGLVGVLEAVPCVGVEVAGRGLSDGLHGDVESDVGGRRRDVCHRDVCVRAIICLAVGIGGSVEGGVVGQTGERITGVSRAPVGEEVVPAICLEQLNLGTILIGVTPRVVIDMPDEKSGARERFIESGGLPVLDEEIFLAAGVSVGPKAMGLVTRLDVLETDAMVFSLDDCVNPSLVRLAPW